MNKREQVARVARAVIAMGKSIRFSIACPPNFENERMHWAAKSREVQAARNRTLYALTEAGGRPSAHERLMMATEPRKRVVTFTRYFGARVREMDHGGLVSACKPVLDALKLVVGHKKQYGRIVEIQGAGLIHDDSPAWVTTMYEQVKDKERAGQLQVEVSA